MFLALGASLLFTLTYATLAAKSRRAEVVLIPLLDVLQSVPILGFLSFTVTFFLNLFPGSVLGAEMAAIFAIFTSQAWNMAFSFYQSLRTVPSDLAEVSEGFRLSPWQKFWQLETPFAVPSLIYNMMMSMSGGWFFVVAAEAITVGDTTIKLPGIGSYLAVAIDAKRVDAVLMAVVTVLVVILLYDQLVFRPIVTWADKFRVELSASQSQSRSWVLGLLQRTFWVSRAAGPIVAGFEWFTSLRIDLPRWGSRDARSPRTSRVVDLLWVLVIGIIALYAAYATIHFVSTTLDLHDLMLTMGLTLITMLRVVVLLVLASLVWVPIAVWVGLRPAVAERVQPAAQFLAAFPAQCRLPDRRDRHPRVSPEPGYLAFGADHLRDAMVYRVQCDRRGVGVPQRPARSGSELPDHGLGHGGAMSSCRASSPITSPGRSRHRAARVERRHRGRICPMGKRQGVGARNRILYCPGDRGRRFPQDRSRRRGHVDLRHHL